MSLRAFQHVQRFFEPLQSVRLWSYRLIVWLLNLASVSPGGLCLTSSFVTPALSV
jgi:hypothetical protein